MSDQEQAVSLARTEIERNRWGVTQQFLAVHEVVREGGVATVVRVDSSTTPGAYRVYFPVRGQSYFLVVVVNRSPEGELELTGVYWEARVRVWLALTSEVHSTAEITALTGLAPTEEHERGEPRPGGSRRFEDHTWKLEPQKGVPGSVEEKLGILLQQIEPAASRIPSLRPAINAEIAIVYDGWKGDPQFAGWHFAATALQRLAALGADLDFDVYARGPDMPEDDHGLEGTASDPHR